MRTTSKRRRVQLRIGRVLKMFKSPHSGFDVPSARTALLLALITLGALDSPAVAGRAAMLAYGRNSSTPGYRLWNGSAWGAEGSTSSIADKPYWLVLRGSPLNTNFVLASQNNNKSVHVQTWNGSSWSAATQAIADCGEKITRRVDVAYEHLSGEILLVYADGANLRYRTYNGSSWSAQSTYVLTAGTITWLALVSKPESDEVIVFSVANDTRAAVWNGSSFGNSVTLSASTSQDLAHGAYERLSGDGLVLFADGDATPGYRTWISGSWSGGSNAPTVGATPRWCRLAAKPKADEIIMATVDGDSDINVNVWSATAWGTNLEVETSAGTNLSRNVDIAYEPGTGQALLVYAESGSNMLRYRTWNGTSWSAENTGAGGGASPIYTIQAVPGLTSGQVFVAWMTDNPQIRTAVWNGSSFGAALGLGDPGVDKDDQPFMVATAGKSYQVVRWEEVEP